jgi:RNA 2',3'-cyclic 3'-phosphodiesterase
VGVGQAAAGERRSDRLFFALYPEPEAAAGIARLAGRLQRELALNGRPIAASRLHVTLHFLGSHAGLPPALVAAALAGAARIDAPSFDVSFDRVASFAGKDRDRPFVLLADPGLTALKAFQRDLGLALGGTDVPGRREPPYTPHVTLLYDDRSVAEMAVEPVTWHAREFVLVHSFVGQGKHVTLGRWPLRDRAMRTVR